jgi:hypothetical protein
MKILFAVVLLLSMSCDYAVGTRDDVKKLAVRFAQIGWNEANYGKTQEEAMRIADSVYSEEY